MRKCRVLLVSILLSMIALLAILFFTRNAWLSCAGRWLEVKSPLRHADAIYVFAGGESERTPYAAELMRKGYAPIVITGSSEIAGAFRAVGIRMDDSHMNAWALIRRGVPARRIVMFPYGTSTYEELVQLRHFADMKGLRSIILVSSPFHMRRVAWCARRAFRGSHVRFVYAPCHPAAIDLSNWWRNEYGLITVQNEFLKLAFYWVKYRS